VVEVKDVYFLLILRLAGDHAFKWLSFLLAGNLEIHNLFVLSPVSLVDIIQAPSQFMLFSLQIDNANLPLSKQNKIAAIFTELKPFDESNFWAFFIYFRRRRVLPVALIVLYLVECIHYWLLDCVVDGEYFDSVQLSHVDCQKSGIR